ARRRRARSEGPGASGGAGPGLPPRHRAPIGPGCQEGTRCPTRPRSRALDPYRGRAAIEVEWGNVFLPGCQEGTRCPTRPRSRRARGTDRAPAIEVEWGNVFLPGSLAQLERGAVVANPDQRRLMLQDPLSELSDDA